MTESATVQPVHFRVVKSGAGKGDVFAVILNKNAESTEEGPTLVTARANAPGSKYKTREAAESLTFVRLHTRVAKPDEFAPLLGVLQSRFAGRTVQHYPKLTRAFLPKK